MIKQVLNSQTTELNFWFAGQTAVLTFGFGNWTGVLNFRLNSPTTVLNFGLSNIYSYTRCRNVTNIFTITIKFSIKNLLAKPPSSSQRKKAQKGKEKIPPQLHHAG